MVGAYPDGVYINKDGEMFVIAIIDPEIELYHFECLEGEFLVMSSGFREDMDYLGRL